MDQGYSVEIGYKVAVVLQSGAAPGLCYVGEVQAVDQRGVRITLIDWLVGSFCGNDLFVPWHVIQSMLVATPEHDLGLFLKSAGIWQDRMEDRKA